MGKHFSPYVFKPQDAFDFARFMNIKTFQRGEELDFEKCPYCGGGKGGRDNEKSLSINLKTGQFNCFRAKCGRQGNMIQLSRDFDFSLGNEVDEYYQPKRKFKKLETPRVPIEPKPEAIQYLESRGISERIAREYEITVRADDSAVLVFPFYDEAGRLQLIKYRRTNYDPEKHKGKEWSEEDCKPILFGMKQCKSFDRLIITEGQVDSLSVAEAGIDNAVSVPTGARGFTWVPYCWNWVNMFKEIIVFGDHEKGHITLLDDIAKRFKCTIKHVREEDYKDCKDANDILRRYGTAQIRKCIDNAVIVPIRQLIDLADVEKVDIFKLPKLRTGINQLDRLLYGGLPFGGITLLSGKTSEGKSVLASQILINAISAGYKCLAYSGELINYQFQITMDLQIAGGRYINEYSNIWGDKQYNVLDADREKISAWYRGKCWLYDTSIIDEDERESLVKLVEKAITQYDVKVILLDNLMTAIDLELSTGSDRYEKQSQFVKKLARLAQQYDVLILLAAHKRKNGFSTNENDEIMGSSDISNLAMVTLTYGRDKDIDESQRLLKISKNRLFGRIETKGFLMDYDPKSKRIYGQGDNLYVDYGWNKESNGFSDINEEVPFEELEGIE